MDAETPKKILYRWMLWTQQLECHSDTGFRRESDKEGLVDGRSAHGANFIRMGVDAENKTIWHLLDVDVGMTKVAVRSTFAAETHGVISTTDAAIVLATSLHEIFAGPLTPGEAKRLTDVA